MPTDHRRPVVRVVVCTLAVTAVATLAGCGATNRASSTSAAPASGTVPVAPILATVGDLAIAAAYVPAPASPTVAAAYLTVIDDGAADTLVRASSDVSKTVTLHRTQGQTMEPLPSLPIPAGGLAAFSPGDNHLMLENLTRTLVKGDRVELTLVFQRAGTVTVTVPVTGYPVGGALPSEALRPLPSTTAAP